MKKARDEHTPLIPGPGEHAVIVGQNGSGKTAFASWLLRRVPVSPVVLYDTKEEPKFAALQPHRVVESIPDMLDAFDDDAADYVIVRPPADLIGEPEALDEYLKAHYRHGRNTVAYVDEAYTFHRNGQAGPGLISLLTRGRSRGIQTILSTQRPSWLSRFAITEAKHFYLFRLMDDADKQRIGQFVPGFRDFPNPVKHGFYYFAGALDEPARLFGAVKLDEGLNTGYVDSVKSDDAPDGPEPAESNPKRVWL